MLPYVKIYAELDFKVRLGWNVQKLWVYEDVHFDIFDMFDIFLFWGRRHEALSFKSRVISLIALAAQV